MKDPWRVISYIVGSAVLSALLMTAVPLLVNPSPAWACAPARPVVGDAGQQQHHREDPCSYRAPSTPFGGRR